MEPGVRIWVSDPKEAWVPAVCVSVEAIVGTGSSLLASTSSSFSASSSAIFSSPSRGNGSASASSSSSSSFSSYSSSSALSKQCRVRVRLVDGSEKDIITSIESGGGGELVDVKIANEGSNVNNMASNNGSSSSNNNNNSTSAAISPSSSSTVDDTTALEHLHEPGLVHVLQTRYAKRLIYTYTGPILLALNPLQPLPHLYSAEMLASYYAMGLLRGSMGGGGGGGNNNKGSSSSVRSRLPPHVYALADDAYRSMIEASMTFSSSSGSPSSRNSSSSSAIPGTPVSPTASFSSSANSSSSSTSSSALTTGSTTTNSGVLIGTMHLNQSMLISGESGAGKTETAKVVMQYLATVGRGMQQQQQQQQLGAVGNSSSSSRGSSSNHSNSSNNNNTASNGTGVIVYKDGVAVIEDDVATTTSTTTTLTSFASSASAPTAASLSTAEAEEDAEDTDIAASVEQRVLDSNPILEAFGNAKTVRNENSSRFGKFIQLQFDIKGHLAGAWVDTYLLEKVRVVQQAQGERSFHIFHQLLAGARNRDMSKWDLMMVVNEGGGGGGRRGGGAGQVQHQQDEGASTSTASASSPTTTTTLRRLDAAAFTYTRGVDGGGSAPLTGIKDEKQAYEATVRALRTMGMRKDTRKAIFSLLAGLLHLGNVAFEAAPISTTVSTTTTTVVGGDATVRALVSHASRKPMESAAKLFGVDARALARVLVATRIEVRGEVSFRAFTPAGAEDARDAVAKAVYGRLFHWIVRRINMNMRNDTQAHSFIGVLDIFGFEVFPTNSFEQLCINMANETLQALVNAYAFRLEVLEYVKEGIIWVSGNTRGDNEDVLALIAARPPKTPGLLCLLDETSAAPGGNDGVFARRAYEAFRTHPRFDATPTHKANDQFVIRHYACDVVYTTAGFCDKNRDAITNEALGVLAKSDHFIMSELFGGGGSGGTVSTSSASANTITNGGIGGDTGGDNNTNNNNSNSSSSSSATPSHAAAAAATARLKSTVGAQFTTQLRRLMDFIRGTKAHYIRCLKPNEEGKPGLCDRPSVVAQLRSGGVLEAVRVTRLGYPTRLTHREVVARYRPVAAARMLRLRRGYLHASSTHCTGGNGGASSVGSTSNNSNNSSSSSSTSSSSLPVTMVDLRDQRLASLDADPSKVKQAASDALRVLGAPKDGDGLGYQVGASLVFFRKTCHAALEKLRATEYALAASSIQRVARGFCQHKAYLRLRKSTRVIQSAVRIWAAKRHVKLLRKQRAAVRIQSVWKQIRNRRAFVKFKWVVSKLKAFFKTQRAKKEYGVMRRENAAACIASSYRMSIARKDFLRKKKASIIIQSLVRAMKARKRVTKIRKEVEAARALRENLIIQAKRITELESLMEVTGLKVTDLQTEVVKQHETIAQLTLEKEAQSNHVAELEKTSIISTKVIQRLETQVLSSSQQVDDLQSQLQDMTQLYRTADRSRAEGDSRIRELEELLRVECKKSSELEESAKGTALRLNARIQEVEEACSTAQEALSASQKETAIEQGISSALRVKLAQTEAEGAQLASSLKSRLSAAEDELESLKAAASAAAAQAAAAEAAKEETLVKYEEKEEARDVAITKLQATAAAAEAALSMRIKELQRGVEEAEMTSATLRATLAAQQIEMDAASSRAAAFALTAETERGVLQARVKELTEKVRLLQEENDAAMAAQSTASALTEALSAAATKAAETAAREIESLKKEMDVTLEKGKVAASTYEKELAAVETESKQSLVSLEGEIQAKEAAWQATRTQLEVALRESKSAGDAADGKCILLQAEVATLHADCQQLQESNAKMKHVIEVTHPALVHEADEISKVREKQAIEIALEEIRKQYLQEQETLLLQETKKREELVAQYSSLENDVVNLKYDLATVQAQFDGATVDIENMKKAASAVAAEIQQQKQELEQQQAAAIAEAEQVLNTVVVVAPTPMLPPPVQVALMPGVATVHPPLPPVPAPAAAKSVNKAATWGWGAWGSSSSGGGGGALSGNTTTTATGSSAAIATKRSSVVSANSLVGGLLFGGTVGGSTGTSTTPSATATSLSTHTTNPSSIGEKERAAAALAAAIMSGQAGQLKATPNPISSPSTMSTPSRSNISNNNNNNSSGNKYATPPSFTSPTILVQMPTSGVTHDIMHLAHRADESVDGGMLGEVLREMGNQMVGLKATAEADRKEAKEARKEREEAVARAVQATSELSLRRSEAEQASNLVVQLRKELEDTLQKMSGLEALAESSSSVKLQLAQALEGTRHELIEANFEVKKLQGEIARLREEEETGRRGNGGGGGASSLTFLQDAAAVLSPIIVTANHQHPAIALPLSPQPRSSGTAEDTATLGAAAAAAAAATTDAVAAAAAAAMLAVADPSFDVLGGTEDDDEGDGNDENTNNTASFTFHDDPAFSSYAQE